MGQSNRIHKSISAPTIPMYHTKSYSVKRALSELTIIHVTHDNNGKKLTEYESSFKFPPEVIDTLRGVLALPIEEHSKFYETQIWAILILYERYMSEVLEKYGNSDYSFIAKWKESLKILQTIIKTKEKIEN